MCREVWPPCSAAGWCGAPCRQQGLWADIAGRENMRRKVWALPQQLGCAVHPAGSRACGQTVLGVRTGSRAGACAQEESRLGC